MCIVSVNPVISSNLDILSISWWKTWGPKISGSMFMATLPLYYKAATPTLGFWLQPWYFFPYTHWPHISYPQNMSFIILMFTFLNKVSSILASWGGYLLPIWCMAWFVRPNWPSHQRCTEKIPKLGAQNCSFLSKIVREIYYMAFLPPSKTIKGSENIL